MMSLRNAICALALGALSLTSSVAQAQVMIVGGGPVYGTTVVVGRPVVPAVAYAPAYVQPSYVQPSYVQPTYSVGYAGYSAYRPIVPTPYVAPAPVVAYRPVVPVYPAYRPGVVSTRAYYPGQPVRNALRVIAP